MTPTLARMVAGKRRQLSFPLRWFSIPNMFRYERPQKGRLREHWQLNADIFGIKTIDADVEIISLAYSLMKNFGAKDSDFEIRINSRKILNLIMKEILELNEEKSTYLMKLVDKKDKMDKKDFEKGIEETVGNKKDLILKMLEAKSLDDFISSCGEKISENEGVKDIKILINKLKGLEIKNTIFSPDLVRGFDYYTGIVFELYDKSPENNRALFGGGRYDDLLDIFGEEKVPAVGFGMGDVTIKNFLEIHNLMPEYKTKTDLYICILSDEFISYANKIAFNLRKSGLNIEINLTDKKLSEQLNLANKKEIPFVICIGENEVKTEKYKIKNMKTGEEKEVGLDKIFNFIKNV
jgi:histidyl-tRNA synthetase